MEGWYGSEFSRGFERSTTRFKRSLAKHSHQQTLTFAVYLVTSAGENKTVLVPVGQGGGATNIKYTYNYSLLANIYKKDLLYSYVKPLQARRPFKYFSRRNEIILSTEK